MLQERAHRTQSEANSANRSAKHALLFGGLAVIALVSFFCGLSPIRFSSVDTGQLVAAPNVENVAERLAETRQRLAAASVSPKETVTVALIPAVQPTPKIPQSVEIPKPNDLPPPTPTAQRTNEIQQASFESPRPNKPVMATPPSIRSEVDPAVRRQSEIMRQLVKSDSSRATVVVFLSAECPASIGSLPQLSRLHAAWEDMGVRFVGVLADPDSSPEWATWFQKVNRLRFPILPDQTRELRQAFGPTHTPEVFVLNARRELVYRGRIDDRFADARRFQAPQTYLDDAIAGTVYNERVAVSRTRAIGSPIGQKNLSQSTTQYAERTVTAPPSRQQRSNETGIWQGTE